VRVRLLGAECGAATDAPFADQLATLAELREQGLIRHIGLSTVTIERFREATAIVEIAAVTALAPEV
jgi:pyridoxine 4-dehydrogenase